MVVRFYGKKEQAGGEKYEKRSKLKIGVDKKGASWYIDQGLKKGMKGEGERGKRRPKFKNLVPFLGLLRKKL